ncbi:type IV pilus modification PilV family protein [Microterricola pindariensis]|uniref:Prepilin-type N-terminal cleavage/methylation domain-containing protein n=1 Tax=Microterricola pindariensis TaxID=478010 RepID=A0ABX5AYS3_9MICO|nr:type II secretion system protein [Microterricola pindariensis]PPL20056.1 hypothetical protein GY24_02830 [Microterricola pindariensis]
MVTRIPEAALVTPERGSDERGFGLVEILVSMLLLSIIAVAFLPLLIQAMKTSQLNATVATATQMVNEQLNTARADISSCATLTIFAGAALAPTTDPRGIVLTPHRAITSGCPVSAVYPATGTIKVWVTDGAGAVISQTVSLVLLKSP